MKIMRVRKLLNFCQNGPKMCQLGENAFNAVFYRKRSKKVILRRRSSLVSCTRGSESSIYQSLVFHVTFLQLQTEGFLWPCPVYTSSQFDNSEQMRTIWTEKGLCQTILNPESKHQIVLQHAVSNEENIFTDQKQSMAW